MDYYKSYYIMKQEYIPCSSYYTYIGKLGLIIRWTMDAWIEINENFNYIFRGTKCHHDGRSI